MSNPGQPGDNPYVQPYNPYPQQPPPKKKRKLWPWLVVGIPVLLIGACTAVLVSSVNTDSDTSVTKGSGQGTPAAAAGPAFPGNSTLTPRRSRATRSPEMTSPTPSLRWKRSARRSATTSAPT